MTKYAVVTTFSTFVHKYVIPMDELQRLNTEAPVELEWAADCVTCEEVEELTQRHLGETIIETEEMTREEVIKVFRNSDPHEDLFDDETIMKMVSRWKKK